ncbi:hypothetical protein V8E51_014043 [Hyaloscypha variabilis]
MSSSTSCLPRISWIGLGNMGQAMSSNLVHKSNVFTPPTTLYDRTIDRAEEISKALPPNKTTVAYSIHDAVQHADIIFTIIATNAVSIETVSTALKAPGGLKGKLWVESSTVDPAAVIKLEAMVEEGGGDFIAMPVFGAAAMAIAGQLVCVPAGPKRCVDRIRLREGKPLKCIGDTFLLGIIEILSESYVVAKNCGVGNEALHKFATSIFPEGRYVLYSRRLLSGARLAQAEGTLFDIALVREDARHAIELAEQNGVRMLNVEIAG